MNAKEARNKYLENYVEFENLIRMLARKWGIITKNVSLYNLISLISSKPQFGTLNIKASMLKEHKIIRNWLVHQHKNSKFPQHFEQKAKNIQSFLKRLK